MCSNLFLRFVTCVLCFSRSGFFQLSRCPYYTWTYIKYQNSLRVCTRVYKHTHTHDPNTRQNREIHKTKLQFLCMSKQSLPRQQQVLTMNKLEKNPTSNPPLHTHAGVDKTPGPVIHTHVAEGSNSKNHQNAPTRVHMYAQTRMHIHVYAYIYTDTHIYTSIHTHAHAHIHAYMHTHIHIHVHAHLYTYIKSQQQLLDASNNVIDAHTHQYTYACIYTYICICTYVHNLQQMCGRCVR